MPMEGERFAMRLSAMRLKGCLVAIGLVAVLLTASAPLDGASFGTVVSIGGQASDIALDEGRDAIYVANFTANRI